MLISRAPLRISLAGGGTDLPAYYERYGGTVVSTTIDKYVYVHVDQNGPDNTHICSADYQTFYCHHLGRPITWDGDLALPRAVLHELDVRHGLSLFVASEVPPGTGLGSSSAVAVALVRGIAAFQGRSLTRQEVAELACNVELNKLGAPIGKQDQYAAAFGGFNCFTFSSDVVGVEPLNLAPAVARGLEARLMLFFTGTARDSAAILREQRQASASGDQPALERLHAIKAAALDCRASLEAGDLDGVGRLLDQGWRLKRQVAAGITNDRIDQVYETALEQGALGGKITGAGGGGFLLLYCHEARQAAVTQALEQLGLRRMDFHFEQQGAQVARVGWQAPHLATSPSRAATGLA